MYLHIYVQLFSGGVQFILKPIMILFIFIQSKHKMSNSVAKTRIANRSVPEIKFCQRDVRFHIEIQAKPYSTMFAATSIELFELKGVLSRHCFAEYDLEYRF